jgi:hypothetical protein
MDNQDTSQVAGPVGPDSTPTEQPQLSIQDLQNLRAIVDTAVRRGAFQAAEASFVGAAFDRVTAFLNAVAPPQVETSDQAASQTPTT